jgi:replicative DNA helicase
MDKIALKDPGSERALLGSILKHGKDAFIDSSGIVDSTDFGLKINRVIYTAMKQLMEDPNCNAFDIESIKMKAKILGFEIKDSKDIEYLDLLDAVNFEVSNIPMFALQIKKYSVVRDLYDRYNKATKYLENIDGNESLSDIIRNSESQIIDFISGADNARVLTNLTEDIEDYIQRAIEEEEVDQVGLPTGYPLFDEAIGGGPRRGTVTMLGARPKVGKSFISMNMAINLAKIGIPVLYLDTELTESYQKARLTCIESNCPIHLFETRKFQKYPDYVESLKEAGSRIKKWPFYYESIAGMSHTEALALVRRWLVKYVGFNEDGTAKDCVVLYDYMKLMSSDSLTKVTPEYIVLGLMLTDMHNFAVKYNIPIIGLVQLNREGIDSEDTNVIAGSDRILWLCSSLTLLKNKDENDKALTNDHDFKTR